MQNRDKNTSLYFLCPSATAGCNYVTGPMKRKWRGNFFALPEAGSYPRVGSELWQCNLWIRNPCHLSKPHWEADSKCSQTTKTWCSHLANSVRCRDMGATDANRSGLGILPCPLICGVGHSCSPCENLGPWQPWQGEAVSLPCGQISVRVGTEDKTDTGRKRDKNTWAYTLNLYVLCLLCNPGYLGTWICIWI